MSVDYELITESAGTRITKEAASMVYTRYALASDLARGRRTLEIGCASGIGLGLILRTGSYVVAGDLQFPMLSTAKQHYRERVPFLQFSTTALPFKKGSFDFVLFLEATYYVRDFPAALDEIGRVLAPGGTVLFVNANPERPDFIRSLYSEHYHSASELRALLESRGYRAEAAAAFPLDENEDGGYLKPVISGGVRFVRRLAEALRLVPRTLRGRARIKRLIFGKLLTLPPELPTSFAALEPLSPVDDAPVRSHKVIYIIGRRTTVEARLPVDSQPDE